MKKAVIIISVTLLLVTGLIFTGCRTVVEESGRVETRQYDVTGFTRLDIDSAFEVEVIRSNSFGVSITGLAFIGA